MNESSLLQRALSFCLGVSAILLDPTGTQKHVFSMCLRVMEKSTSDAEKVPRIGFGTLVHAGGT